MASKYSQGTYIVKNPEKYVGNRAPVFRSSWERVFFSFCDNNPNIISWGSECLRIPYKNPFTNRNTVYIPDLLIMYQDKDGKKITELIEIKPASQTILEEAKSQQDKAAVVLNMAKWAAAKAFCKTHGIVFRVVTEAQIFNKMGKNKR
jgi:hypothetical protein